MYSSPEASFTTIKLSVLPLKVSTFDISFSLLVVLENRMSVFTHPVWFFSSPMFVLLFWNDHFIDYVNNTIGGNDIGTNDVGIVDLWCFAGEIKRNAIALRQSLYRRTVR